MTNNSDKPDQKIIDTIPQGTPDLYAARPQATPAIKLGERIGGGNLEKALNPEVLAMIEELRAKHKQ